MSNVPVTEDGGKQLPLCVDLDGTLVLSDLLLESLMQLLKSQPWTALSMPFWVLRGRAAFKAEVAARIGLNLSSLPYNKKLMAWLEMQRGSGRKLWLCTAANEVIATRLADHLQLFDGVLASNACLNLSGSNKAARLEDLFGYRGFDYCGNDRVDIHVWRRARGAIVIGGDGRLAREAAQYTQVLQEFPASVTPLQALVRALRFPQWIKNVLVLLPLVAAHRMNESSAVVAALLTMVAFCLCAASVYVLNDLFDLETDRSHATKGQRSFAAGDLSILIGVEIVPMFFLASLGIGLVLPRGVLLALGGYFVLGVLYSHLLKGRPIVHELSLAGFYFLRVAAGAAAIDVQLPSWSIWFCASVFVSLACIRRFAALNSRTAGEAGPTVGSMLLQSAGIGATGLSVIALALYARSPHAYAYYDRPEMLWVIDIALLYWVAHLWSKARDGHLEDDPVLYALKDRISWLVGMLVATLLWLAS